MRRSCLIVKTRSASLAPLLVITLSQGSVSRLTCLPSLGRHVVPPSLLMPGNLSMPKLVAELLVLLVIPNLSSPIFSLS